MKRRAERNNQLHISCPCPIGPVLLQYPSISSASSQKILPVETCQLCTFVKIKPQDCCTNRSTFACAASLPWELKHFTLAKDIYCQKLHFHCLGSKTSVKQIKQIMRHRVSHWSQRSEVRIWFKHGMTHEKTLHGDGNLIAAELLSPCQSRLRRKELSEQAGERRVSLTLAAVHSQPKQCTPRWSSCFEELRLTSRWLWMQSMTHFKQVGQENLHLSAFRDLFQNTEDLPWKCFPYCLMLRNSQWEYWQH